MSDFQTALKQVEAKPKAKKQEIPFLKIPQRIKDAVDTFQAAKKNKIQAEATMKEKEAVIIDFVREKQDLDGFADKYHNSYALKGEGHEVKVIYAKKWSINPESKSELKKLLKRNYNILIKESYSLSLRKEVFEDGQLQKDLLSLIGDRFKDFFESKLVLNVTENFSQEIYQMVDKDGLKLLRSLCQQNKPSLK
jgi:hypothetical protein